MVEFALTHDEAITLIRECKNKSGKWRENAIIWECQYFLLRRISEVLDLRPHNILWDRQEIEFYRTKTGTLNIRCPQFILNDLRMHLDGRTGGYVFHTRDPSRAKIAGKPQGEVRRSSQQINIELREACREILGIVTDRGHKPIKDCPKCEGDAGNFCSLNNMKWKGTISTKACEREGRPIKWIKRYPVRCHALRGSGATVMSENGIPTKNIMEAGGWRSRQSYDRYIVKRRTLDPMGIWELIDDKAGSKISGQTSLSHFKKE